jgi:hemerythrin-like domain-containing protein
MSAAAASSPSAPPVVASFLLGSFYSKAGASMLSPRGMPPARVAHGLLIRANLETAARRAAGGHTMAARKQTAPKKPSRNSEKDAIALLKEDHERVRGLLSELEQATDKDPSKREKLLATIEQELKVHTKIEEDVFYPAFFDAARKSDDKELYYEAVEEHHVVDLVLPEIHNTDPSTEQFAAKAKVLKDLVEHHADEEESEMFPRARKLMNHELLVQLGRELVRAKESA